MGKGFFEDLGITNKEIREFAEAMEKAARNKQVTEKFKLVEEVVKDLKEYTKDYEADVDIEYGEESATVYLKSETSLLFSGKSMDMLRKILNKVDIFIPEIDLYYQDMINLRFIIENVFKL